MNSHRSSRKIASLPELAAALALMLFAVGCEEEPRDPTPPRTQNLNTKSTSPAKPALTASPNPVEGDSKTTTITWDVAQPTPGEVYVSSKGGPEHLLARGIKGSKQVDWVGPASAPHEFRLYAGNEHKTQLATLTVTHEPKKSK